MRDEGLIEKIKEIEEERIKLQPRMFLATSEDFENRPKIISNFRKMLYLFGTEMASRLKSTEMFSLYLAPIAYRPGQFLWDIDSIIEGAAKADNSNISLEKATGDYIILPHDVNTGGVRLYVRQGEKIDYDGDTYSVGEYAPTKYHKENRPYHVKLELVKRSNNPHKDLLDGVVGKVLASLIEKSRLEREKEIPFDKVLKYGISFNAF